MISILNGVSGGGVILAICNFVIILIVQLPIVDECTIDGFN